MYRAGQYSVSLLPLALLGATLGFLQLLRIPAPPAAHRLAAGRPMRAIAQNPIFVVAVLAGTTAYTAMNFTMVATPLAMLACGHGFGATKLVMQIHVLGMFVPSFFTGHLIKRFGVLEMMLAGAALLLASVAINTAGVSEAHFQSALLLLGVGWNFLYVGASTLLTQIGDAAERNKIQAAHDFLVFGMVSLSAYSSGALHAWFGWQQANLGVLPAIVLAALAILWLRGSGAWRTKPA